MREKQSLLMELDKLKAVYRRAYLSDGSRNENSAEHSWHLAVALMVFKDVIPESVDMDHAIKLALVHDICEIGAGDISVYDVRRSEQAKVEGEYMASFEERHGGFGKTVAALWREYEDQTSEESRWVKALDRLLPFLMNLATQGRTWKEQDVRRSQVVELNKGVGDVLPEVFEWMKGEMDAAVRDGWLVDG